MFNDRLSAGWPRRTDPIPDPALRLGAAGLFLVPVVVVLAALLQGGPGWGAEAVAAGGFLLGAGMAVHGMARAYPHDRIGACNVVTLLRLVLACALIAAVVDPVSTAARGGAVFAIAALTLALDGADGWLARRSRLASTYGARFDMEVDAAFAAILSLVLLTGGRIGAEVLVLGFTRYAFVLVGMVLPWMRAPLPDSLRRKTICVIQIATLTMLTLPVVPDLAARWMVLAVGALLLWSFARDILRLAARR